MKRFWIAASLSFSFSKKVLTLTVLLDFYSFLTFFVFLYESTIFIFLEKFWIVPRAETSPCSCSSVLFSSARCPHLPLFLSLTPTSFYPHFPARVPYSWQPSDTNTSLRVVWAPIVLGFWIVIFRIVGLGIVIVAPRCLSLIANRPP